MDHCQEKAPGTGTLASRLPLVAALAVAIRTIQVLWTTTIAADSTFYLGTAKSYSQALLQHALKDYHGLQPLYPLMTATLGTILGNLETAAYCISVLASGLGVIPLYYLVQRWWNSRIASWACLIYALHPTLSDEASEIRYTGLFLGLFITTLALGVAAVRGTNWALYPLTGLAAGLCDLARPEAVYVLAFALVEVVLKIVRLAKGIPDQPEHPEPGQRSGTRWMSFVGGLGIAVFIGGFLALPYVFWVRTTSGRLLTSRVAADALGAGLANAPAIPPIVSPSTPAPAAVPPPVAVSPSATVPPGPEFERSPDRSKTESLGRLAAKKFMRALYWPLAPFLLAGFAFARRQGGEWKKLALPLGMAALTFIPPLVLFARASEHPLSHRYFLSGITLLLPWIAAGFVTISDQVGRWLAPACTRFPRPVLAALPSLILGALLLTKGVGPRRPEEVTFREAGLWLRQQVVSGPRYILTSSEKVGYYGDFYPIALPAANGGQRWIRKDGSWEPSRVGGGLPSVSEEVRQVVEAFKTHKASYVVMDEDSFRHRHDPGLLEGLELLGFERCAQFEKGTRRTGVTVWIYRPGAGPR